MPPGAVVEGKVPSTLTLMRSSSLHSHLGGACWLKPMGGLVELGDAELVQTIYSKVQQNLGSGITCEQLFDSSLSYSSGSSCLGNRLVESLDLLVQGLDLVGQTGNVVVCCNDGFLEITDF